MSPGVFNRRLPVVLLATACLSAAPSWAADVEATSIDFARDVAPLLAQRCGQCHGKQKRSAKLNLATPVGIARGGESGAAVAPGRPEESLLWQRVAADEMPPDSPLSSDEKRALERWIAAGAPGIPRQEELPAGPDHWSFQPLSPLSADDATMAAATIDRFVTEKLTARGWRMAPAAEPTVLLRRVAVDLTGLPPTPTQAATFLADTDDDAYERLVQRFLASPRYGERWGKHWLDAAGYADSNGYFNADTDRPLAYRYRDWVIRAHNDDLPLDRFLQLQIAGDELIGYTPEGDVTPEMVDALTATHFLRNSQDGTGESDGNDLEQTIDRYTVLEGTVQIVGSALLGLTLQCCRCHDHKFEPLTQRDYYGLQAILRPAYSPDQWRKPNERVTEIGALAARQAHHQRVAELDAQVKAIEQRLAERSQPFARQLVDQRLSALADADRQAVLAAYDAPADGRSDEQQELLKRHEELLKTTPDQLAETFGEFAQLRADTQTELQALDAQRPAPLEKIALVTDWTREPPAHRVLVRGDYAKPGVEAPPAAPAELATVAGPLPSSETGGATTGRRLALARWLTAPQQPLVARVVVNRVWQQHFGRGLVATVDNLGYTGAEPTHAELLDYLTAQFVAHGWRLKWLHQAILLTATYRQSSAPTDAALAADPDNALLSHSSLRRLDAEAIRDSLLFTSGELDTTIGGPYIPTQRSSDGHVLVAEDHPGARRRSVYLQQRRTQTESLLGVFDAPSLVTNCVARHTSTAPLQSLTLLNSRFALQRAAALAKRLDAEAGASPEQRIDYACLLAWSRPPRDEERAALLEFLTGETDSPTAWAELCQMILASSATLYVE